MKLSIYRITSPESIHNPRIYLFLKEKSLHCWIWDKRINKLKNTLFMISVIFDKISLASINILSTTDNCNSLIESSDQNKKSNITVIILWWSNKETNIIWNEMTQVCPQPKVFVHFFECARAIRGKNNDLEWIIGYLGVKLKQDHGTSISFIELQIICLKISLKLMFISLPSDYPGTLLPSWSFWRLTLPPRIFLIS